MKKHIPKINFIFFLLLPFVDLITSLTTRLINLPVSLGVIIKSLYLLIISIYIIFFSKSKHRKKYIIYFITLSIYSLLYFITKSELINVSYLFNEVSSLFKIIYGSLLFFALLVLYDDFKYKENDITKLMFYSLMVYVALIIIPTITKTNFNSYTSKNNEGSIGWFFAANDIGAILLMLYPYIYFIIEKNFNLKDKKSFFWILLLIPIIYSIFIIGTKTTWLGLILITIILFIIYFIKKNSKINIYILFIVAIILGLLTIVSPTMSNINKEVDRIDNKIEKKVNNNTANSTKKTVVKNNVQETVCTAKKITEIIKNKKIYKIIHLVFSGRENKAYTLSLVYKESSISDKLLGVGFTNSKRVNNCFVEKYIEIDFLDILVHYGILGLIFIIMPYAYLIKSILKKKIQLSTNNIIYIMITTLMIIISLIAGHIIGYPSPNIYLSIYMLLIFININQKKSIKR